jgi:hypothetical protein
LCHCFEGRVGLERRVVDGPHFFAAAEGPDDDFEAVFLRVDAGFEDQAALGDDLQREVFGALFELGRVGFLGVFFIRFAEGAVLAVSLL